jgi:hypothetical protein
MSSLLHRQQCELAPDEDVEEHLRGVVCHFHHYVVDEKIDHAEQTVLSFV